MKKNSSKVQIVSICSLAIILALTNSCKREESVSEKVSVDTGGIKMQYYGIVSDSAKLIVRSLKIGNNEQPSFCLGCDGVGYGSFVESDCIIDSMIVGPGSYVFSFDVNHPCIDDNITDHTQRYELGAYSISSSTYPKLTPDNSYEYSTVHSQELIDFGADGIEKNFD